MKLLCCLSQFYMISLYSCCRSLLCILLVPRRNGSAGWGMTFVEHRGPLAKPVCYLGGSQRRILVFRHKLLQRFLRPVIGNTHSGPPSPEVISPRAIGWS